MMRDNKINTSQEKLQLSILKVFSIVSVIGIAPFVFIRYTQANIVAMIIDVIVLFGILMLVLYAHRTGKVRVSSAILAVLINAGALSIIAANGINGFLWVYPVCAVSFFLVKPYEALVLSFITGLVLVNLPGVFNVIPIDSYIMTSLMLSLCAFFYACYGNRQLLLLARLNTTDPLTGALNRRALNSDLAAVLSRAEREGNQHLLAMLDLDHFKKVNDKYGHAVGDQVLQHLVSIIKAHIRKYDQLYRFGGEEFVLLIPDIP